MSDSSLVLTEGISPLVSTEMNQTLTSPPTTLVIQETLFSIHLDKAPRADGFSASFYYSFWDIIDDDFVKDVQAFFASGSLDRDKMRHTFASFRRSVVRGRSHTTDRFLYVTRIIRS